MAITTGLIKQKDVADYKYPLRLYMLSFQSDADWYASRIEMYLARHGRQWSASEEARAASKNIPVMSNNVIRNLIDQKTALIANLDAPADFEVSSESSGESDINRKAMAFLNYSYAKSGGARLFERGVDLACTVGQDLQLFEPFYDEYTNEFYIKFRRVPFYRYYVLGYPIHEYFDDAAGVLITEDITIAEIARRLKLTDEQVSEFYTSRFQFEDFFGFSGAGVPLAQGQVGERLLNFYRSDGFKEFSAQGGAFGVFGDSNDFTAQFFATNPMAMQTARARVLTHIYRGELRKAYKIERAGDLSQILNAQTPEEALELKKPNWNYLQKVYFKEELEKKHKRSDGSVFTINDFIEEDIKNGFATKKEISLRPVTVRKYYGRLYYEEYVYATDEYPFTPMHRIWEDDKYSVGDVDAIFDMQRVYNENMSVINAVQREMMLGDRYIFNNAIEFTRGDGSNQSKMELLDEFMSGDRRAIFGDFPRFDDNLTPFIKVSSQPLSESFIRYTYDMPNQMTERMGMQSYLLGAGGLPRTVADAENRANFGTAQIKSTAYALQRAVAEHGRKALIYAQLEAKLNLEIELGDERIKYNEMRFNEQVGRYMIHNELMFDKSPLRLSFRGTEYHKNYRIKQTILESLRYMPQGSPAMVMMSELLIKLEEIPELDDVLARANEAMNFQAQLQEAQQQLKVLTNEQMRLQSENQMLKVNMDTQRRIAINREKINRELNKLVSEIRAMSMRVQANADKEIALQLERIRATADMVLNEMEREGLASEVMAEFNPVVQGQAQEQVQEQRQGQGQKQGQVQAQGAIEPEPEPELEVPVPIEAGEPQLLPPLVPEVEDVEDVEQGVGGTTDTIIPTEG